MTAESINFMSQCIHAGGQNFTGCEGLDDKGMFKNIQDLKKCLQAKGWTKTEIFAPGNPIFQRRYAYGMIATAVEDKAPEEDDTAIEDRASEENGTDEKEEAAAVEQLEIWSKRSGAEIVKRDEGRDPASV